ncbi:transglycosylase domain-containing protein [Burkholderia cenocepacia]|uniref:penicillin-binding protein 1A n=1 Tax=Burkholderia cenocepacia TaxID=95486 RepID=UPI00047F88E2|nr:transglycosylase domain-containing protein [Burkholderia cenocepacia]MBR7990853.1 transglycosylase domain-containing protein [Burkholderia cenocepacia]
MNRFVPFLRDAWLRCRARVTPLAAACRMRVRALGAGMLHRLRHPTRRGVALTLAAIPVLGLLLLLAFVPFTPSIGDIRKARIDRPARVLSADGQLIAEFRPVNREWVPLKQISPHMIDALIATEDHRFYAHHGIDWRRTLAAGLHTFSGDRQGGSTITQQLARNLYPDEVGRAPTLTRKVKELITAFKIEAVYSKDEILETYLNTVPFLYNAYGVEMAARTYFGKSADQLDLTESATLVGMLKGNSYYNPVLNPERAVQRRNVVLGRMAQMGMLSPQQFAKLQRQPLRVDFEPQTSQPGLAPHFAVQLRKWLIAWADRNNYDLYSDGLVVRTTLDARLQDMATQALTRQTERLQAIADDAWRGPAGCGLRNDLFRGFMRQTPEYRQVRDTGLADVVALKQLGANRDFMRALCERKTQVQAGFVAIDPRTGAIRAWVGSPDFGSEPFDHVVQARRQPGSTFKPFVYGAAFADGMRPGDTFVDGPVAIPIDGRAVWRPTDAEPPTGAPMTLRDGLALSRNRITAQVMQREGAAKVAQLARAMGVRDSPLDAVPSLALGTSPVTLKEMVSAYGTIANRGVYVAPQMITRIEDRDGKVLAAFGSAPPERALPAPAALTLVDAMRGVVDYGTGADIRSRYGIRIDVAGKTGTTQDNTDGWFILMHPQLVAGAWVGFDDGSVTLRSDYWGAGAHSALPIVGSFYDAALRARAIDPRVQFSPDFRPRSAPAPKRRAPQHSGLFDWLRFFR